MNTIYFLRHQAAGVLWQFPFDKSPTPDQVAPIQALLEKRYGVKHTKTQEPYWLRIVEVTTFAPGHIPSLPPEGIVGEPGATPFVISAKGSVSNPKK